MVDEAGGGFPSEGAFVEEDEFADGEFRFVGYLDLIRSGREGGGGIAQVEDREVVVDT